MNNNLLALNSLRDLIRWAASEFNRHNLFFGHGTDNALDEALALVMHVTALDYSVPDHYLDCQLSINEKTQILALIQQRIETRKPLAYLTGEARFANIEFYVNEHTLVPRSPIAELLMQGYYPWVSEAHSSSFLDLCTGSGCIGIASALYMPQTQVVISDISTEALAVARRNIQRYDLADQVTAMESDVFSAIPAQRFDIIVSNPPYVAEAEYQQLPEEYRQEPKLGLTAEHNGMQIVEKILAGAADYLTDNGVIIIEVGASADLLMQRYPQVPFNWIEFEHGGDGVFIFSREELITHQPSLT